jgi:hypothetical protein
MTGATASATSRTVVEVFAPIAMLDIRMAATATLQLPMAHHDLTIVFNMISILPWICFVLALGPTAQSTDIRASHGAAERTMSDRGILHVRSDRWPRWACRRAPTGAGGTARTLAGSVL